MHHYDNPTAVFQVTTNNCPIIGCLRSFCTAGRLCRQAVALAGPGVATLTSSSNMNPSPPGAAGIYIQTLGDTIVFVNGILIKLSELVRRQVRQLFRHLLDRIGKLVSYRTLFKLFWPEKTPEQARDSMYDIVYLLRKSLEAQLKGMRGLQIIRHNGGYMLVLAQGGPICSDDRDFDQLCEEVKVLQTKGESEKACLLAEQALQLCRGEYLPGPAGEEEDFPRRRALRRAQLRQHKLVAEHRWKKGDPGGALQQMEKAHELDPLDEFVCRRLMEWNYAQGHAAEAVRQYQVFKKVLRRERNLAPSPFLQQLYQQIKAGR